MKGGNGKENKTVSVLLKKKKTPGGMDSGLVRLHMKGVLAVV